MPRKPYLVLVALMTVVAIALLTSREGPARAHAAAGALATTQAGDLTPVACTGFLHAWSLNGLLNDDAKFDACVKILGIYNYCAEHNANIAQVETGEQFEHDPWRRAIVCSPNPGDDDLLAQYAQLVDQLGKAVADAMVAALPYIGSVASGVSCLSGVVFACATLALDVADRIGGLDHVAGDAIDLANHGLDCVGGDIVGCFKVGAQGLNAAGVQIPGVDAGAVADAFTRCSDGDLSGCVQLGDTAATAAGLSRPTRAAVNVMDCIEGNTDACVAVGKEVAQAAGFPMDKIEQGIQNAQACLSGDLNACIALGQSTAVATKYPGCMEKALCKTKLLALAANHHAQGAPPPQNLHEVVRDGGSIMLAWDGSADTGAVAYVIQRDGVPVGKIEMPPEFLKPINAFKRVEWRRTAQYTDRFTVDPMQDYDYLVCPWHEGETLDFVLANNRSCAGVKSRSLLAAAERGAQRGGVRTTPVTQAAGSSGSSNASSTPLYTAPAIVDGWPQLKLQTQGEPVRSLQYLLQAQGATLKADGLFGPETQRAVVSFQQAQGLTADGVIGAAAWQALLVTVQQGSAGPAVQAVQSQLNVRGAALQVDGVFGQMTDTAVRQYQQTHGLAVDGLVGPQTWQALLSGQ